MKILLVEGQPGAGKTTYCELITKRLTSVGIQPAYVDEGTQDASVFGDFWDVFPSDWRVVARDLPSSWKRYICGHAGRAGVHVFDNSLMNQVQYLMILGAPMEAILGFFNEVTQSFSQIDVAMIFLDGHSEALTNRAYESRQFGWGDRVAGLLERYPFQIERNRTGRQGMTQFFADAQVLKRKLLSHWPYGIVRYDVTGGSCGDKASAIYDFLGVLGWNGTT